MVGWGECQQHVLVGHDVGELEACQKPVTLGTKYWRFVHVKHNCEMLHEILIY